MADFGLVQFTTLILTLALKLNFTKLVNCNLAH